MKIHHYTYIISYYLLFSPELLLSSMRKDVDCGGILSVSDEYCVRDLQTYVLFISSSQMNIAEAFKLTF